MARGLDVIGDRWTLLIVRDLLLGPKRYTDLLSGLPGIGTNLLATRLQEMEAAGLLERARLPPPAGSAVYRLTETGAALEPTLAAIGRWGSRFLGAPLPSDTLVPRPYLIAIRHTFRPGLAVGLTETYELRVGDNVFEVRVDDGTCTTREGPARDPDAVIELDVQTLNALLIEGLSPQDAIASGRVGLTGDPSALDRFARLFAIRDKRNDEPAK
jgi:DNA-binding HxlR family transcriptional regulator/putative sterol carrier protein